MRCKFGIGRSVLPQSLPWLSTAFCAAAIFAASGANGALVTHFFTDGAAVNGTSTAFDTPGDADGSQNYVVDDLKLTSEGVVVPIFVEAPAGTFTWNGTSLDYSNTSGTNFAGGTQSQLSVSNDFISGTGDSNSFNPQESWIISYDAPVIFREIDARRFDGPDLMKVTFGSHTFEFDDSDFNVDDKIANPFGELIIPANTLITITNSRHYASYPVSGSAASLTGDAWGLQGFTVEVPEPSAIVLVGLALVGIGAVHRRFDSKVRPGTQES